MTLPKSLDEIIAREDEYADRFENWDWENATEIPVHEYLLTRAVRHRVHAEREIVCESDHHLVHEGGWTLTMTPDRVATWSRPDGIRYWTGTVNDPRPIAA